MLLYYHKKKLQQNVFFLTNTSKDCQQNICVPLVEYLMKYLLKEPVCTIQGVKDIR